MKQVAKGSTGRAGRVRREEDVENRWQDDSEAVVSENEKENIVDKLNNTFVNVFLFL